MTRPTSAPRSWKVEPAGDCRASITRTLPVSAAAGSSKLWLRSAVEMDTAILWTAFTAHHPLHFGSLGVKDQSILSAQYCAKKNPEKTRFVCLSKHQMWVMFYSRRLDRICNNNNNLGFFV